MKVGQQRHHDQKTGETEPGDKKKTNYKEGPHQDVKAYTLTVTSYVENKSFVLI